MYAVFAEGRLAYLGNCQDEALKVFNAKPNANLHTVQNMAEVDYLLHDYQAGLEDDTTNPTMEDDLSDAFQTVIDKLDEWGINKNMADKVREGGEKLVGEARSLGVRGMRTVGDGFIALGELLRRASEDEQPPYNDACHLGRR